MRSRGPGPATAPTPADADRAASVRAIAEQRAGLRGALLPILHEVVASHGYVDDDDLPVIADVLNLSRADVLGVVSFYHDFRRTPPPAHQVALCRGEACQARGAQTLFDWALERWHTCETIGVSELFCLGNCALGPAAMVDGTLHGRLDTDRLDELSRGWDR